MTTRTIEQQAEEVLLAVKAYLDQTARKHDCAGFDCKVCALNGDRFAEAKDLIIEVI